MIKDGIDRLIYRGTQNTGSYVESEAFTDLSSDSIYYVLTTGGVTVTATQY